jgi:hypothetical protein
MRTTLIDFGTRLPNNRICHFTATDALPIKFDAHPMKTQTDQLGINDVTNETVQTILQLATNAESLWHRRNSQERRTLLERLLSNRVWDGVSVQYKLVKPLQTLSEMKEDINWRIRRQLCDSNGLSGLPGKIQVELWHCDTDNPLS